jgi:hypothetical protein
VASGTHLTLTATAASGSTFAGWGGACTGTGGCDVTVTGPTVVRAEFALDSAAGDVPLVVELAGDGDGTVTSSPAGIACGAPCGANFAPGTVVTLTASPGATSSFAGWSGACTADPCTVTLDQLALVTATFAATRYPVVVNAGPGFGVVWSDPPAIDCGHDCTASVRAGTTLTLTATPNANAAFIDWQGDCAAETTPVCTLTIDGPKSVTANIVDQSVELEPVTVVIVGDGQGTVSTPDGAISCPGTCGTTYEAEIQEEIDAVPGPGSVFAGWSGTGCSGTNSICVTDFDAPSVVIARFDPIPRALSVSVTGAGGGTIVSQPAGIYCGLACDATFDDGTVVTLTAAGGTPTSWGGACAAASGSTCVVTMSADFAASAAF